MPNLSRSFNLVYTAWLDYRAGIRHLVKTAITPKSYDHPVGESPIDVADMQIDSENGSPAEMGIETNESEHAKSESAIKVTWRSDWRQPEPLFLRCPLCFVADPNMRKPDHAVVILDGNFSQRRLGVKSVLHRNKSPDRRLIVAPNSSGRYNSKVILTSSIELWTLSDKYIRMMPTNQLKSVQHGLKRFKIHGLLTNTKTPAWLQHCVGVGRLSEFITSQRLERD